MAEFIAIGFQGKHRAAEVLEQLYALDPSSIELRDAVTVYRTESGKMRVNGSVQPTTADGAAGGALVGGLLGAIIAAPFTAGASAAVAAAAIGTGALSLGLGGALIGADDAAEWKELYGIPDEFVREVGGMVQPGQSAVFMLASAADPTQVAEQFRGYGGKVLRTTLSPKAAAKIQQLMTPQMEEV